MNVKTNRILSLFMAFCIMLTFVTPSALAVHFLDIDRNILWGRIQVMGVQDEQPNTYRAARDKNDVIYIQAEDFAQIAGGLVSEDTIHSDSYCYRLENWTIVVYCEDKTADLYYNPSANEKGLGYPLYDAFKLTDCLYNKDEDKWYIPFEEMLYMAHMQWMCEKYTVFVFQPETLLDFVAEIDRFTAFNPTYTDVMGNTLDQTRNSFKYGFQAAIDELDMTFILDSILTTFLLKDAMSYEDDVLVSALLMLRSDTPENSPSTQVIGTEEFADFVSSLSTVLDGATQDKVLNTLQTMYSTTLDSKAIQAFSKRYGLAASVAGHLFGAGQVLWMREQIPNGFNARMEAIKQTAVENTNSEFHRRLSDAADEVLNRYVNDVKSAYTSKINIDSVFTLVDQVIGVVEPKFAALEVLAPKLNSVALGVALFDLGVETMKQEFPSMQSAMEEAEDIHLSLELVNISTVMHSTYEDAIYGLRKYHRGVDQKLLDDIRLSAQVMQCAAMHACTTLENIGKLSDYGGLSNEKEQSKIYIIKSSQYEQESLSRLAESSKYDKLLILNSDFSDIHSEENGCVRQEIPPEYILIKVTGNVVDKDTQEPIPEAEITLTDNNNCSFVAQSELDGNFEIWVCTGMSYEGKASASSYLKEIKMLSELEFSKSILFELKEMLPLIEKEVFVERNVDHIEVEISTEKKQENIPQILIRADIDSSYGYGIIEQLTIEHKNCVEVFTYKASVSPDHFVFFGIDMGDGEYTYVINLYSSGTMGGAEVLVLRIINDKLIPVMVFNRSERPDDIWVEGTFISDDTVRGIIHPTETNFEGTVSIATPERIGTDIWENGTGEMNYELNKEGFYDLIFCTYERNLYNGDSVGSSMTRYILKNEDFAIAEQWFTTR